MNVRGPARRLSTLLVTLVLVGAGCGAGGDGSSSVTSTASTAPTASSTTAEVTSAAAVTTGDPALDYFQAIATHDPDVIGTAVDLAVPGSLAEVFALHQQAADRAQVEGRQPPQRRTAFSDGETYWFCEANLHCVSFVDVDVSGGSVESFTIDGQPPLEGRLGDGRTVDVVDFDGAAIETIGAYRSDRQLFVTFRIRPSDAASQLGLQVAYEPPGGEPVEKDGIFGQATIEPGDIGTYAVALPPVDLGGTMTLMVAVGDDPSAPVAVAVPLALEPSASVSDPPSSSSTSTEAQAADTSAPPLEVGDEVVDLIDLEVGQCFDSSTFADETAPDYGTLTVADCAGPHDAEIFQVADIPGDAGAPFPDEDSLYEQVDAICLPAFQDFVGIDYFDSRLELDAFAPIESTWRKYGDRRVACFVMQPDHTKLTGTMAGVAV